MIKRGGLFYFGYLVYFPWHIVFTFGRAEFLGGVLPFLGGLNSVAASKSEKWSREGLKSQFLCAVLSGFGIWGWPGAGSTAVSP